MAAKRTDRRHVGAVLSPPCGEACYVSAAPPPVPVVMDAALAVRRLQDLRRRLTGESDPAGGDCLADAPLTEVVRAACALAKDVNHGISKVEAALVGCDLCQDADGGK